MDLRLGSASRSLAALPRLARFLSSGIYFTKDHEWIDVNLEKNTARVGVTEFAQKELGDVVFVDMPETGKAVKQKQSLAGIESVKAAADVNAPLSGEVIGHNEELVKSPHLVNKDPTREGWIVELSINKALLPSEEGSLLTKELYEELLRAPKSGH